jgi:membrane protein implicated in regulation of membrane protease activity
VRDDLGAPVGWDLAFLAFGVLLIVAGMALERSVERTAHQQDVKQAVRAASR